MITFNPGSIQTPENSSIRRYKWVNRNKFERKNLVAGRVPSVPQPGQVEGLLRRTRRPADCLQPPRFAWYGGFDAGSAAESRDPSLGHQIRKEHSADPHPLSGERADLVSLSCFQHTSFIWCSTVCILPLHFVFSNADYFPVWPTFSFSSLYHGSTTRPKLAFFIRNEPYNLFLNS